MAEQPPGTHQTPREKGEPTPVGPSNPAGAPAQEGPRPHDSSLAASGEHQHMPVQNMPAPAESAGAPIDINRLVADHHRDVYRFCYRLAGKTADAEDLTQQTFLQAHAKLHQLRDTAKPRGWLLTIARNCFLKSQTRGQPCAVGGEFDLDQYPGELPPESPVDGERLQRALDELPDAFRVVVVMFYFEDCSYRDIAAKLDLPMGTVMSRLARAKQHLRNRLFDLEAAEQANAEASQATPGKDSDGHGSDKNHTPDRRHAPGHPVTERG